MKFAVLIYFSKMPYCSTDNMRCLKEKQEEIDIERWVVGYRWIWIDPRDGDINGEESRLYNS